MEQEAWQKIEIDSTSQELFKKFIQLKSNKKCETKSGNQRENTTSLTLELEGNPQENNNFRLSSIQQEKIEDEDKNNDLVFSDSQVILQGNKFQVTASFVLLTKNLYEYSEISFRFKFIGLDTISKIFDLIKVGNVFTLFHF